MAKNNSNKPKAEKIEKIEPEITEVKEVKSNHKAYIVRDDLGFKKRNFHTGSKLVLLIAGEEVDEKTYNLFSSYCKETFFK